MLSHNCTHCNAANDMHTPSCWYCHADLAAQLTADGAQADEGIGLRERLRAGVWFACAGAIPAVLFLLLFGGRTLDLQALLFFLLAPSTIAGLFGEFLGASILDEGEVSTAAEACWRGLVVAVFSFITYLIVLVVPFTRNPNAPDPFATFLFLCFYGSIFVGWLVLLVGASAGWLLFKCRAQLGAGCA
jgi:hypothetical protein